MEPEDLIAFFAGVQTRLLAVASVRHGFASTGLVQTPEAGFNLLVQEAATTLTMVREYVLPGQALLEVGGGVALMNAWLQHKGFDVMSLEPAGSGHDSYYDLGRLILVELGLDTNRWLPYRADEAGQLGRTFDLVFSNNVLEHMTNLDESLAVLAKVLKLGGRMRHNCPNYLVPYEPHFGIPLVPFRPRCMEILWPRLKNDGLWQSINFITAPRVKRIAHAHGLTVTFDRGHIHKTFERLTTEPAFRAKHLWLARVYRVMKALRVDRILKWIPESLATPMQMTMSHAE